MPTATAPAEAKEKSQAAILGQPEKALADYSAALELDPNCVHSLYGRGIAKLRKGDRTGGEADVAAAKLIFYSFDFQVIEEARESAPEKRLGTTFRALGDA